MYLNMKFQISFKQINCVHEGWDTSTIWTCFSPWDHYHSVHHKQDCL